MPNTPVDVDSWGVSACYPRRTFYPLSDGPSTQNHRITRTDFRLCSTCQSRSQAGLCSCTQQPISDRLEPTFARLRYSFGGEPQSNCPSFSVPIPANGTRLDTRQQKGRISTMAPPRLAPQLQSLRPILHIHSLVPVKNCSKGARGLSV